MTYIVLILLLIGAATFGLCFVIDRLIGRIRKKRSGDHARQIVRQPTRAAGFGIVLLVGGICVMLFLHTALGLWGGLMILFLGALLIGSYFLFSIKYDDEGFTYCTLRGKRYFHYNQIHGEQAIAARSGINVMLFVGDTAIEMSEAMSGVREFLSHAYYARCRQLSINPEDCPPPAPGELLWFPAPSEE